MSAPASRRARLRVLFAVACVAVAAPLAFAGSANAVQSDLYDVFTACPTDDPLLNDPVFMAQSGGCVASVAKPGSTFRIGENLTTTSEPSVSQWAFGSFDGESLPVVPGSTSVTAAPQEVEGGLLGLVPPEQLAPLIDPLDPVLGVQSQVQSAGDVSEWLLEPPTTRLKIKLINPVLGDNCYIGSDDDPIVLQHEDWVTEQAGMISFSPDPNGLPVFVIHSLDGVISNSAFSVPEANGCGPLGLGLLDPVINNQVGLPSPAGSNEARFLNDTHIVGAESGADIQAAFDAAQEE
ncbi:MAG: hypothetical protein WD844_07085 [Thermoleophilaceae bacterium]